MDAKKVLIEQFDKIALGLGGLVLLAVLAGSFLGETTAEAESARVASYNKDIAGNMDVAKDQLERRRRTEPRPDHFASVQRELTGGAFPQRVPGWLFHKRPLIATKVIGEQLAEPHHLPPVDFTGTPGLGRISLSWADGRNEYVDIVTVKVYRKETEGGDWGEAVADLDGKTVHAWEDKQVEPGKRYWYILESYAELDHDHPAIAGANKNERRIELAEDERILRSVAIGPFSTKRDTYVDVLTVIAETLEDRMKGIKKEERAWIKVWRYFPEQDAWLESPQFEVRPGELGADGAPKPIGQAIKRSGVTYDFQTSFHLLDVDVKKIEKQDKGFTFSVDAHVAKIKDLKTGQVFEINNQVKDPGLEAVIEQIKRGPAGGGDEAADDDG